MKIFLTLVLILGSLLAQNNKNDVTQKKERIQKQLNEEIEKEKLFAKEQTFYKSGDYNLKRSEVNIDSLDALPEMELDDLDMDSVYD